MWSHPEIWHVPPRPGPSQGNLKPKVDLSGTNRELRANKTPFNKIKTVTWIDETRQVVLTIQLQPVRKRRIMISKNYAL